MRAWALVKTRATSGAVEVPDLKGVNFIRVVPPLVKGEDTYFFLHLFFEREQIAGVSSDPNVLLFLPDTVQYGENSITPEHILAFSALAAEFGLDLPKVESYNALMLWLGRTLSGAIDWHWERFKINGL